MASRPSFFHTSLQYSLLIQAIIPGYIPLTLAITHQQPDQDFRPISRFHLHCRSKLIYFTALGSLYVICKALKALNLCPKATLSR
ncbi:hypothetical protein C8J56DRAFT_986334 [Mycena floridula]|nr:hypothetical protein C8J56DRAFT_986334 [Mycena floridula]